MSFGMAQTRLLQRVREMVHCGELTERGLARATGVSQPHVHNMLKGVRAFSLEFADQLLQHLGLTLVDFAGESKEIQGHTGFYSFQPVPVLRGSVGKLSFPFTPERHGGVHPFPRAQVASLTDPVVLALQDDQAMFPLIHAGDLILLERAEEARIYPESRALYVVETPFGTAIRYIRFGGRSLYMLTEHSIQNPMRWDYVSLAGQNILEVVRGRIVWIGRALEENPAQQARKAG